MQEPWYTVPKPQFSEKYAIIIGGGIAGTSAAYSLAKRGWNITLIERNEHLAEGASGNPVGIVAPLITHKKDPIGEFYFTGFEHSISHFKNLNANYKSCGVIELTESKINKDTSSIGLPARAISQISKNEARSVSGINISSKALYLPTSGFICVPEICNANIASYKNNITVIYSRSVLSLQQHENGWLAIDDTGKEIAEAPVVIIANAADAKSFSQSSFIPTHQVRGQLTYLPAMNLGLQKILCYDGGYIAPEVNGFHCVGATYSRGNISQEVTTEDHIENITNLRKIFDIGNINPEKLKGRISFRAGVIDRRPVIGAVPDVKSFMQDYAGLKHGRNEKYPNGKYLNGLYISAGHGSRGLTSAPIGGEIIASMINGEKLPITTALVNLLSPARFIIKTLRIG